MSEKILDKIKEMIDQLEKPGQVKAVQHYCDKVLKQGIAPQPQQKAIAVNRPVPQTTAIHFPIAPRIHTAPEVVSLVNQAMATQRQHDQGTVNTAMASVDDMGRLMVKSIALMQGIKQIDYEVAIYRDQDLKDRITEETGGSLMKLFYEAYTIAQRLNEPLDFLTPLVKARSDAIIELCNNPKDNGQALREVAAEENEDIQFVVDYRGKFITKGRSTGSTERPIDWLCERLVDIHLQNPTFDQDDSFEELFKQVTTIQKQRPIEWKKLEKWNKDGIGGKSLWRNVGNRPYLKEKLENRKFSQIS